MSGLLLRALRSALRVPAAARPLRTAAPRAAFAKELFRGALSKVRGEGRAPNGRHPPVRRWGGANSPQGAEERRPGPAAPRAPGAAAERCWKRAPCARAWWRHPA